MADRVKEATSWLPHAPSPAVEGRVFCIPHAGCGAGLFRRWPRTLASVEFLPVELPGRETRLREPALPTVGEIATAMVAALAPYLDVPYVFFGHCWSALVAYEAAVEIRRLGLPPPAALVASSQFSPQESPVSRMLEMDDAEMADELSKSIRALGGAPHPDLVALYVEVLRADVDAGRHYHRPVPVRLDCPVVAVGWTEDEEVAPEQMGGWSECGDTTFEVFTGRHHRFIEAPQELLAVLASRLVRGRSRGSPP